MAIMLSLGLFLAPSPLLLRAIYRTPSIHPPVLTPLCFCLMSDSNAMPQSFFLGIASSLQSLIPCCYLAGHLHIYFYTVRRDLVCANMCVPVVVAHNELDFRSEAMYQPLFRSLWASCSAGLPAAWPFAALQPYGPGVVMHAMRFRTVLRPRCFAHAEGDPCSRALFELL